MKWDSKMFFTILGLIITTISFISRQNKQHRNFRGNNDVYSLVDNGDYQNTYDFIKAIQKVKHQSKIMLRQYDSLKIFSERDIPFDIDSTSFIKKVKSNISAYESTFINNTNKPVVLIMLTGRRLKTAFCFLKPYENVVFNDEIKDIDIYTGKKPQIIEFLDPVLNNKSKGFRFKEFSTQDKALLRRTINENTTFPINRNYTATITPSKSGVYLNIN